MSGIFAGIFERRFHVSQEPPGWVVSNYGWTVASGVQVTPEKALEYAAVFACIRNLAEDTAKLPLTMFERTGDRSRTPARAHPLNAIWHDIANPEMTAYVLRELMMQHLASWGNFYGYIDLSQRGEVTAIWPLNPQKTKPKRDEGGALVYEVELPLKFGRQKKTLPAERIFHVPGLGNGIMGASPIQYARQSIGLGLAAEEFGSRFFANDARPGVVYEHPGKLSDKAFKNLKESLESAHTGLSKAHKVEILEEGLTLKEVGIPPEDAQYLQTRRFQTEEIARWYRMPPHKIQDLERSTNNNIEHQSIEYVTDTLMPWGVRIEQEISRQLMTPRERERFYPKHMFQALMRGDVATRNQSYAVGRQWGWLSADDVRDLEDMNPLPDGQGQTYYMPLNMIPADQVGSMDSGFRERPPAYRSGSGGAIGGGGVDQRSTPSIEARSRNAAQIRYRIMLAQRPLFREAAGRILRREANDVGNKARAMIGERGTQEFSAWLSEFYTEHADFVTRQMWPILRAYAELVAAEAYDETAPNGVNDYETLSADLERFVNAYANALGSRHAIRDEERIREVMRNALAAGEDPVTAIVEELDRWPDERATTIAQEESNRSGNALAVTIYRLVGVSYLVSVATGASSCPYCLSLNGKRIGINQYFLQAGENFQPDGAETPLLVTQNRKHAPYHKGCDCITVSG